MRTFLDWLFRSVDSTRASGDAGSVESDSDVYSPDRKLTFDETVAHMARGYDNTQRVIQLMDAKAGAIVALSLAIFAFVGKVLAWAFEQTDSVVIGKYPCWLLSALVILGGAILICGFLSLMFAFKAVRPNHLPSWGAFSTLFPAHSKEEESKAIGYLKPLVEGANCGFAVDEFGRQLVAVGQIVHRKINWLRSSIQWLHIHGLVSVLLMALISWMGISGMLVKEKPKEDVPLLVPAKVNQVVNQPQAPAVPAPVVQPVSP
jgi:hypothetical protein